MKHRYLFSDSDEFISESKNLLWLETLCSQNLFMHQICRNLKSFNVSGCASIWMVLVACYGPLIQLMGILLSSVFFPFTHFQDSGGAWKINHRPLLWRKKLGNSCCCLQQVIWRILSVKQMPTNTILIVITFLTFLKFILSEQIR